MFLHKAAKEIVATPGTTLKLRCIQLEITFILLVWISLGFFMIAGLRADAGVQFPRNYTYRTFMTVEQACSMQQIEYQQKKALVGAGVTFAVGEQARRARPRAALMQMQKCCAQGDICHLSAKAGIGLCAALCTASAHESSATRPAP